MFFSDSLVKAEHTAVLKNYSEGYYNLRLKKVTGCTLQFE